MDSLIIENGAPDGDHIHISDTTGTWNVTVWRDEYGETHVVIADNTATQQRIIVLGEPDNNDDMDAR